MQIRLLPKQNQQKPKAQPRNLLKNQQENLPEPKSPNLFKPTKEKINFVTENHVGISLWIKLFVILSQILFIGIITLNSYFEAKLLEQETEVSGLYNQLVASQQQEQEVRLFIQKISLHKQKSSQPNFAEIVEKAISLVPNNVRLLNTVFNEDSVVVVVETDEPLPVTLLVDNYLKNGLADEITINSAVLNAGTNKFVTNLEFNARN